ncbi:MAG: glycoside hydrolase family 13 protein, partial [Oscillospiraceae bacterium]
MGANGIRLDVADELPDNIISLMRTTLKSQNNQNFLLGEVWEDATTKQSYGQNRKYALGNGLDSVMNYPFRENCLSFLLNKITAYELCGFLTAQALNYPPQM